MQALTALACVALLLKLLIGFYIHQTTFEPANEGQGQKETQLGGLSSHNKSSSATSGGPADPIPKRLQAAPKGPSSGSLSVGSVKVMHDNPLRLSDAQAPPPPPPPAHAHAHAHAHRPSDAQVDTHALARSHGQGHTQASPLHRGSDAV